jgi:hypothetical protein
MDVIDLFFDDLAEEAASPEIEGTLWYERVYERGVIPTCILTDKFEWQ